MTLREYKRKRNFTTTGEPRGKPAVSAAELSFVVQKHAASHLHFDFRLEHGGVMKSWAVPKGPSINSAVKRLAVEVEDHPVEYGAFEGTIPQGEYGGGTVMIWDRGTWQPDDTDITAALRKGSLTFTLHGTRLAGKWLLRRTAKADAAKPMWLLMKSPDESAEDDGDSLVREEQTSVVSGRTMEEIASGAANLSKSTDAGRQSRTKARAHKARCAPPVTLTPAQVYDDRAHGGDRVHAAKRATGTKKRKREERTKASSESPGQLAAFPQNIKPALCKLAASPPRGAQWVHEVKYDGYRLVIMKQPGKPAAFMTRSGLDWTAKFAGLARTFEQVDSASYIIDGEAVVLNTQGISEFYRLANAVGGRAPADITYCAFDLLYLHGRDLTSLPLLDRKSALSDLLGSFTDPRCVISDYIVGEGELVFESARAAGLEGIISKRADSPYLSGRHGDWVKCKFSHRQEFIVVGYTPLATDARRVGSLALAAYQGDKLTFVGAVGTGFDDRTRAALFTRLSKLQASAPFLNRGPTPQERIGLCWIAPATVVEVEFAAWTPDIRLRHATFRGVRGDKALRDVTIEVTAKEGDALRRSGRASKPVHKEPAAMAASPMKRGNPPKSPSRHKPSGLVSVSISPQGAPKRPALNKVVVAGVVISHPDRPVFPNTLTTKLELAQYYDSAAELILPYLKGRPLSILRCTSARAPGKQGIDCFFQRHAKPGFGDPAAPVDEEGKPFLMISTREELITLVQKGAVEFHPWGCAVGRLELADSITFDLDPGVGVSITQLRKGARWVREILAAVKLTCFVKTSGGKGLHVVAPLRPACPWEAAHDFARTVATLMSAEQPEAFTHLVRKDLRAGRIYVDYLRNTNGATSIAAYSARARERGPVSVPITWAQLSQLTNIAAHTVQNIILSKSASPDPWKAYFELEQTLPGVGGTKAARKKTATTKATGRRNASRQAAR